MAKAKPLSLEKYFVALSKDSLIYGLGNAILKILAIAAAPILTRIFAPSDYGIISLIASIISFLSLFLIFGLDTAVFMAYNEETRPQRLSKLQACDGGREDKKKEVVSSGFWFLVYWDAFLVGLCILFAGPISQLIFKTHGYAFYFGLAFATAFFTLITNYTKTIFRIQFQAKTFALISIVGGVLITGLALIFVAWFKLGLAGYFLGGLIGTILKFMVALYLVRGQIGLKWSPQRAKEMALYGSMLVPASLSYYVFNLSDRFFVNHYRSLDELGLYSMAANLTGLITFFAIALSKAWLPLVFNLYAEKKAVFHRFVPRIFVYYLIFFMGLALLVTFFGYEILVVLTTPQFYGATRAIGPLALAMVFSATVQITSIGIYVSKQTKLIALSSGMAAIVNIIANFLLIPRFGMIGAGWATAISYLFLTAAYLWLSQHLIYLKIDWVKVAKILILGFAFVLLAPLSWRFGFWPNLGLKVAEFIGFGVLLYLAGVIEQHEVKSFQTMIAKAKERLRHKKNDHQEDSSPIQE